MRIFLTGFMGSGKSTLARRLARRLGYPVLDLDEVIHERTGLSVSAFFARHGETAFRQAEHDALLTLATLPRVVVACGGGTPCFHNNMAWMNEHGLTIYLDTPVELLLDRLRPEQESRPLLAGKSEVELRTFLAQKLAEREACYRQAHVIIQQTGNDQDLALLIEGKLPELTGH